MKFRHIILLAIGAVFITACNMTLAADVTPPPGYVPPTPVPTLGATYPASAPDVENGKVIYAEKCAPCHGETGLGDGEQGKELPVSVIPIGLPEIARKATPAKWYATVTQGNLDRFMPPFLSLSEQERWDVVAYAFTLHTTNEQVEAGKSLFEEACAGCAKYFGSQEMMSALSANDLVRMMREGAGEVPAFGKDFSDEEAYAVAAYIRTLTFAPPSAPIAASATEASAPAAAETPPAEGTPGAAEQAGAESEAGASTESVESVSAGRISGRIENRTGGALPSDLKVTLHGYDHGVNPSAGPQEILTLEAGVEPDGTYVFEDIEVIERQIFVAEVELDGLNYRSEFAVVPAGAVELTLPDIVVYATSDDYSVLQIDALHIFFDLAGEDTAQIFAVYSLVNPTDKTILVNMGGGQSVPFIAFPEGATGLGYEATQDTAPFLPTADGFAMPPSETPYGLIAFSSLPKTKEIKVSQPALLPVNKVTLYLPEGVNAKGAALTDNGVQTIQNTNFHLYTAPAFDRGETIEFTLSGKPKNTAVNPNPLQNQTFLIGIGALGVALVLAGVWMYLRERNAEEYFEEEDDNEFEDAESIMDAIIALDDLHRAGKIADEAYQQRRSELKKALKRKT